MAKRTESPRQRTAFRQLVQQLVAGGWKEQRCGTICINGTMGTNLMKDGQVLSMRQDFFPDEEFLEQEWGK
jgi:hypothetical protein